MEFLSRASYHRWILFSRRNFSPLLSRSFPRSTPVVAPRTVQPASSLQDTAVITANLYLSVSLSLSNYLSLPPSSVSFSTASEDIDRSDVSWIEGKLAKEKREKMEETEKWREETGRWGGGRRGKNEERRRVWKFSFSSSSFGVLLPSPT